VSEDIRADCRSTDDGWICTVVVTDRATVTSHEVEVRQSSLENLAGGHGDPVGLVMESFAFLLERESQHSILPRFEISEIERYFPNYPEEMRNRVALSGF